MKPTEAREEFLKEKAENKKGKKGALIFGVILFGVAVLCGGMAKGADSRSTIEMIYGVVAGVSFFIAIILLLIVFNPSSLSLKFNKLFCPHCDKFISLLYNWDCPYCGGSFDGDSLFLPCPKCSRQSASIICPHCEKDFVVYAGGDNKPRKLKEAPTMQELALNMAKQFDSNLNDELEIEKLKKQERNAEIKDNLEMERLQRQERKEKILKRMEEMKKESQEPEKDKSKAELAKEQFEKLKELYKLSDQFEKDLLKDFGVEKKEDLDTDKRKRFDDIMDKILMEIRILKASQN